MKTKSTHFAIKTRVAIVIASIIMLGGVLGMAFAGTDPRFHVAGAYHLNFFAAITLISGLINLGLLFYFARYVAKSEERTWLSFYIAGVAVYTLSYGLQEISTIPIQSLFWATLGSMSALFAPALYLFSLNYTNQSDRRYPGITTLLLTVGGIIALLESYTNIIFINSTKYAVLSPWGFDFRTAVGQGLYFVIIWDYVLVISAVARLINFRRHTTNPILRRQSMLFILAILIPGGGGMLTDVVLPSFGLSSLPPFSVLFGTPAALLMVYGIIRYKITSISPAMFANTILSTMQESVVVTDKEFKVLFINERAQALLGVDEEAARKLSLADVVAAHSKGDFEKAIQSVTTQSTSIDIEHIDLEPKVAKSVPVRITGSFFTLGDTEAWVLALADISRELATRRIIEHEVAVRTEELNEARAYLISSINSLEQGFVLVNRNSKVEVINGVAVRLFQSSADTAPGLHLVELTKPLSWNIDLPDIVHKVLDARKHRQIQAAGEDGSFYEVYVTPVVSGDRELGATVIIQDVTEQKILDRSKDEFFSIASHELRTPLTAIRGNMSMVHDYFPDAMKDESLAAMVDDTHAASIRLIEIVSDFLDSSKLEQGKMVFNLAPTDVKPMVEAVVKDLAPILKAHTNTVTIDPSLDKLPKVTVDEGRYRQIVYNLLSNATKYTQNGTITVTADHDDKSVTLHVTDTGKGIPPEGQKLLFHKFQQAGESTLTRDDTKGTGLGLYISKLLATHMKGDVFLEKTEEGKGSTFGVRVGRA